MLVWHLVVTLIVRLTGTFDSTFCLHVWFNIWLLIACLISTIDLSFGCTIWFSIWFTRLIQHLVGTFRLTFGLHVDRAFDRHAWFDIWLHWCIWPSRLTACLIGKFDSAFEGRFDSFCYHLDLTFGWHVWFGFWLCTLVCTLAVIFGWHVWLNIWFAPWSCVWSAFWWYASI